MTNKIVADAINTYDDDTIPSGMLSSPHIAYCIKKYGIIENYEKSCLGPATYHMRLGGKILTWKDGKKVEYLLGMAEDKNKNIFTKVELEPNSLTFVTTIEKFNLPKDIIARFNLKSQWVHEGLLLGTGPIVDPELNAHLLIPLHNFSSKIVTLDYAAKLISVEFTKTLNPNDIYEIEKEKLEYKINHSRIFDFEEYRKRIGGKQVESSVSSKFYEFNETFKEYKKRLGYFSWGAALAAVGLLIGLIALIFTTWSLIGNARDQLTEATNIVKVYSEKKYDLSAYALTSTVERLEKRINELEEKNSQQNKYVKSKKDQIDIKNKSH